MRKVIFQMMVSLDGYFEGPKHELDWHHVDDEFNDYAIGLLDTLDTLVFGRVTYELMADYWPSPDALKNDPQVAQRMNRLAKVVFSRTLEKVEWNNSRLAKNDPATEVAKLKQQPGKDIAIFGSSDLMLSLIPHGLVNEYRIFVNPVVLGSGKTLFEDLDQRLELNLVGNKMFKSGLVGLYYRPAK